MEDIDQWTEDHDKIIELMKDKLLDHQTLKDALEKVRATVNVFHRWKDSHFNLLFHAILEGNKAAFEQLLNMGANPLIPNNRGTTILALVIKRDWLEWAELTLKLVEKENHHRFINASTPNGWTALMIASDAGHPYSIRWLLKNGAIVNAAMNTGWTALHSAAKKSHYECAEILLKNGASQYIAAAHRDFGTSLAPSDVTADENMKGILKMYCN